MIRGFILFFILFIQFYLAVICEGDVPMDVDIVDFSSIAFLYIIAFLVAFIRSKNAQYTNIIVISFIFVIIWSISLMDLIACSYGPKFYAYAIDILGVLGSISIFVLSLYKYKTNSKKK